MSVLWMQVRKAAGNGDAPTSEWAIVALDGGAFTLDGRAGEAPRAHHDGDIHAGAVLLLRSRSAEGDAWLIMSTTQTGVRINGTPLHTGIRVLQDRDELHVDGLGRVFFSSEQPARIETFPGAERSVFCPRCKQGIESGCPAVRCPQCGVWHHQSEELPCWTYSEHCTLCDQPTDLDGSYRWTPEGL